MAKGMLELQRVACSTDKAVKKAAGTGIETALLYGMQYRSLELIILNRKSFFRGILMTRPLQKWSGFILLILRRTADATAVLPMAITAVMAVTAHRRSIFQKIGVKS